MRFEWDEAKRVSNIEKHGLDFLDGPAMFTRPYFEAAAKSVPGENRWQATGTMDGLTSLQYTPGVTMPSASYPSGGPDVVKKPAMTSYSLEEIELRRGRGESRTDFARVHAKTEAELEHDIATDPDFRDEPANWYEAAEAVMPAPKQLLSLRLDTDVVNWFREQGPGYQTRINAVLRAFVTQQGKRKPSRSMGGRSTS